jgi:hypothetical protein
MEGRTRAKSFGDPVGVDRTSTLLGLANVRSHCDS